MASTSCFGTTNAARPPTLKLNIQITQRWRSGRTRTTRNRVTGNCTGVRIPLSAPKKSFGFLPRDFLYNFHMVILISGTTHTGKTVLAQKLLEEYKIPYYSIDHLKMGLIRSGQTALTPSDDKELVPYLWSIVKEIIKTAVENKQNLVIEGCYIPFDWQKDFSREYLKDIKYCCLIMTVNYIENHFADILKFENVIENRLCSGRISKTELINENMRNFELCKKFNLNYILIDTVYNLNIKSVFK